MYSVVVKWLSQICHFDKVLESFVKENLHCCTCYQLHSISNHDAWPGLSYVQSCHKFTNWVQRACLVLEVYVWQYCMVFTGSETESVQLWFMVRLPTSGWKWWWSRWHSRNLWACHCKRSSVTGWIFLPNLWYNCVWLFQYLTDRLVDWCLSVLWCLYSEDC